MIINYSITNYILAFWEMLLDAEDYALTLTLKWAFISYDELFRQNIFTKAEISQCVGPVETDASHINFIVGLIM